MAADAFAPARLGSLALRNRVIKTATYEGMCPGGVPSAQLVEHHRELAAGGVGLTTVAYCSVSADGRTFEEQMYMRPEVIAPLRVVTDAVHREGGAASLQLGHCGWFTKNKALSTRLPRGPSLAFNGYGLAVGKPVALINTSPHATHAHAAMTETLRTMSVTLVDTACVSIAVPRNQSDDALAEDPAIADVVRGALASLAATKGES